MNQLHVQATVFGNRAEGATATLDAAAISNKGNRPRASLAVFWFMLLVVGCRSKDKLPAADSKGYLEFVSAFYTGVAGLQVGDDVRAEASLAQAAKLVPGEPAAWVNWGVLALRQRSFDAAADRLRRAHELAPADDRIDYLMGVLESARGNTAASIGDLREAIKQNPRNLRAMYRLATEIERQGDANSDGEVQALLQQILTVEPDNLSALVDLCRISAKRGDMDTLNATVARIAKRSGEWSPEVKQQVAALAAAAASPDHRAAATRSTFLRNVLMRDARFRADLGRIAAQPGEETEPMTRFLRVQTPSSHPAPMDGAMTFTSRSVQAGNGGVKEWIGALQLNGSDSPMVAVADGRTLRLANGAEISFPGGAAKAGPSPEGVLPFDFNYDFKTDLLLAGAGGIRLYRQDAPDRFTDVTAAMKLSPAMLGAAYTGAWAVDVEADGDLDVVLGAKEGEPTVLRNNGDGTFVPIHPFAGVSGVRQFAWADWNGDGNPDAALIDGSGRLRIFLNQRAGRFEESKLPRDFSARAITAGDTNPAGLLQLNALLEDGSLTAIGFDEAASARTSSWTERSLGRLSAPVAGEVRLRAADVDNNGAVDLILMPVVRSGAGAIVWLQDENGAFRAMEKPQEPAAVFDVADTEGKGRLDLVGLSADGLPAIGQNHGTKDYHWQTIRPRARQATGDQRINSFGIGGEIEIRAGLLVQKQPMTGPALHFGLGNEKSTDVARILWPNGSMRAEFDLKADQQIVTEQRLKGSCPFLFAWDGSRMEFVKDSVPWGSAIGLRINSLGTADIAATEEWYKIGHDQLKARDGFYDLRITGELWETYFYDSLALMTVDHPVGTEVFTDERYDVPAVKLAVTATGEPHAIARAIDDNGTDVTQVVSTLDGEYLDTFGRGQYQGITRDHYVEIDLGEQVPDGPLWLIAKGWLHPSDSTVNVAMGQGTHAAPRWLSMEVPDGHGGWRVARPNLGFPAGRNKTCLIDLTGLFQGNAAHRLRLRTNLEIYWDSIEWAQGLPSTQLTINRAAAAVADLHYRGFSAVHQPNASSPEIPQYDRLASTSKIWRDLSGFYTRFGDVRELLANTDDRYVIMNAGDEMSLRFTAPAPPPAGWVRDYVLAGDGWIKDGDFNSAYSQTVMPYPHHTRRNYDAPPARLEDDWMVRHHAQDWLTYQTRYVDGDGFRDALRSGSER